MRELFHNLDRWILERGEPVALATVVRVFRSAPRPEGAKLALSIRGELSGSVSGGCVEAGVAEAAQPVLATGRPALVRFGIGDDVAWDAGLTCGGAIEILIERLEAPLYRRLRDQLVTETPMVVATVVSEGSAARTGSKLLVTFQAIEPIDAAGLAHRLDNTLWDGKTGRQIVEDAQALLRQGYGAESALRTYLPDDSLHVYLDVFPRPPHLAIFGAVHIAIPLVRFAHEVGFRTTVVDPRSAFATPERLGHAGTLLGAWPQDAVETGQLKLDDSSYVAVLSHDPKLDEPAIRYALEAGARYVGAIGSRRTQADRAARLRAAGLSDDQIRRVRGPIGLDIGARTPEEIALAIMGEAVAAARGTLSST
ncbi:MAG: XdhC family protein [Chloroflexi bacterium]|nr:XdhC family protein [Chloroflexota bacterium]